MSAHTLRTVKAPKTVGIALQDSRFYRDISAKQTKFFSCVALTALETTDKCPSAPVPKSFRAPAECRFCPCRSEQTCVNYEAMRVAMISMHTSPLDQAGSGDAGGMNVYIRNSAIHLAQLGVEVDVFTRATRPRQGEIVELVPGVRIINCVAGPYEGLAKEDLPTQMAAFARSVMQFVRDNQQSYALIHSHYWLSGQVAWLLKDLWQIPWVHTSHTLAAAKNNALAAGDRREPESRMICEQQIVDHADYLVVNTRAEAQDLKRSYDAQGENIHVIAPGVDVGHYTPGSDRATERSRRELGISCRAKVIGFVGRLQRLKGPHVLLRAVARLRELYPEELVCVVLCGGSSGAGEDSLESLQVLAEELGLSGSVRFLSPRPPEELVSVYRAVDVIAVPSFNESFGLVALEAQACGTPVVATRVGGLLIAVAEGQSGVLVDGHEPEVWAEALAALIRDDERRIDMGCAAPKHAAQFCWSVMAGQLNALYRAVSAGAQDSKAQDTEQQGDE